MDNKGWLAFILQQQNTEKIKIRSCVQKLAMGGGGRQGLKQTDGTHRKIPIAEVSAPGKPRFFPRFLENKKEKKKPLREGGI